jgi:predicted homoserine dehydrogenase-like protein
MKIRFYMDEDVMRGGLVRAVRSQRVEVITASDAGMDSKPDDRHLRYAAEHGLVLYSYNIRDYRPLHNSFIEQGLSHARIVLLEQKLRIPLGEQMRRLVRLADKLSAEEMVNRVEFLSSWG